MSGARRMYWNPSGPVPNCTATKRTGEICGDPIPDDAPVSLCARHLIAAFTYCQDRIASATFEQLRVLPLPRGTAVEYEPALRSRLRAAHSVVYYAAIDGLIKIGTTVRLADRMNQLGGNLLVIERGGRPLERERHNQFAAHLRRGREYFYPAPELLLHIAGLLRSSEPNEGDEMTEPESTEAAEVEAEEAAEAEPAEEAAE